MVLPANTFGSGRGTFSANPVYVSADSARVGNRLSMDSEYVAADFAPCASRPTEVPAQTRETRFGAVSTQPASVSSLRTLRNEIRNQFTPQPSDSTKVLTSKVTSAVLTAVVGLGVGVSVGMALPAAMSPIVSPIIIAAASATSCAAMTLASAYFGSAEFIDVDLSDTAEWYRPADRVCAVDEFTVENEEEQPLQVSTPIVAEEDALSLFDVSPLEGDISTEVSETSLSERAMIELARIFPETAV